MSLAIKADAIWFLADARGGGQTVRTKHWQRPEDAGMPHNVYRVHRIDDDPDLSLCRWDRKAKAFVDDPAKIASRDHESVLASLTDPEFMARLVLGQADVQARVQAALNWKDEMKISGKKE